MNYQLVVTEIFSTPREDIGEWLVQATRKSASVGSIWSTNTGLSRTTCPLIIKEGEMNKMSNYVSWIQVELDHKTTDPLPDYRNAGDWCTVYRLSHIDSMGEVLL